MSVELPGFPLVGAAGEPFPLVVEAGKVAEFTRAVGADPDLGVPPTFLEVARHWRHPRSLAWTPQGELRGRTLNGSQEYSFPAGPLRVGLALTGQMRVADVFAREGRRAGTLVFVKLETRYEDERGTVAAIGTQTTVTMERRPSPGSPSVADAATAESTWAFEAPPLTITDSVRYQGACGDMSPVHHDADRAREMGHRDALTVGGLPAGILAAKVGSWLGGADPERFRVGFRSLVWPGEVLTYAASVKEPAGDGGGARATDVEMTVTTAAGATCLTGSGTWISPVPDGVPQFGK